MSKTQSSGAAQLPKFSQYSFQPRRQQVRLIDGHVVFVLENSKGYRDIANSNKAAFGRRERGPVILSIEPFHLPVG